MDSRVEEVEATLMKVVEAPMASQGNTGLEVTLTTTAPVALGADLISPLSQWNISL